MWSRFVPALGGGPNPGRTQTWDGRTQTSMLLGAGTYRVVVRAVDQDFNVSIPVETTVTITSPIVFGDFGP